MDQRRILVVESDPAFAQAIAGTLQQLGLQADITGDGTQALQVARSSPPVLILLCVELPKMSGYSICNKLKKNPDLKGIPLVIMSSEATPDIFEQHKKLKTRAEDYLIKPFPMTELVTKVRHLLGLGAPPTDVGDSPAESNSEFNDLTNLDDTLANDQLVYDDQLAAAEYAALPATPTDEVLTEAETRIVDSDIAAATDMAFAALEIQDEEPGQMEVLSPSLAAQEKGMAAEGEPLSAPPIAALEVEAPAEELELESTALVLSGQRKKMGLPDLPDAPVEQLADLEELTPLATQEVPQSVMATAVPGDRSGFTPLGGRGHVAAPNQGISAPIASGAGPHAVEESLRQRVAELEREAQRTPELERDARRVGELERENRRLQAEVQSERARAAEHLASSAAATAAAGVPGAPSFSRDRELLNLREVINKKEKEILDLKDDLDSKERQILDHKDKVRELERKVRDMDEKLLGIEREIVGANEKAAAMQQDKEKLVEREKGVKARLEEAKAEIEKSYVENDDLKAKHKEALDRALAEQGAAVQAKEAELTALRDAHTGELARLRGAHAGELEQQRAAHGQDQDRLRQEHAAALAHAAQEQRQALEQAERTQRDEIAVVNQRHDGEVAALRASQNEELNRLRAEHERALEEQRVATEQRVAILGREHEAAQRALRDEHTGQLAQARQEHAAELESLAERHRRESEQRAATHAGEKEALRTEHAATVERLSGEHASKVERLEGEHGRDQAQAKQGYETRVLELEQRHKDRVAGMESRHHTAAEELQGQIAGVEQQLVQTREAQARTEGDLKETRGRASALEIELQSTQEMVADRDQIIGQHERQATAYQDQLLRAFDKIRSDEQLAEKAKRAMAIAIALLDEQQRLSTAAPGEQAAASSGQ